VHLAGPHLDELALQRLALRAQRHGRRLVRALRLEQPTTDGRCACPDRAPSSDVPGEMKNVPSNGYTSPVSRASALVAIALGAAALLLLGGLHVLSPEFDPSWRMVSEYANGRYGWVLSLMFAAWGLSSWALAVAIWSAATTTRFRIGVALLVVAGAGEALAAVFDINHDVMHTVAGALGILGLPVSALLISSSLGRIDSWSPARRPMLWSAHLTGMSVLLLAVTFVLLVATFSQVPGGPPATPPKVLPHGVIGLLGWANRLLVLVYNVWVVVVAWGALQLTAPRLVGSPFIRSRIHAPSHHGPR
jgi:hypothetical protein